MSSIWIRGVSLAAYGFATNNDDQTAGGPSHLPAVPGGVSITIRAMSGASERRGRLNYDGRNFTIPTLSDHAATIPKAAAEEARRLSQPGQPLEVLARGIKTTHDQLLAKHTKLGKFSWQWTPQINTFREQRAERSAGWCTWSPDGRSVIQLNVVKADGTAESFHLTGGFSHARGQGKLAAPIYASPLRKIADILASVSLAGAPADWRKVAEADIDAVVAAVGACTRLKAASHL